MIYQIVVTGQTEMVSWLLDQGADIDATGWLGGHAKGTTALHMTVINEGPERGHVETARLLIERGADLTIKDELYGGTAEGWAGHHKHPEVEALLKDAREQQAS